jgi:hypothetical protein
MDLEEGDTIVDVTRAVAEEEEMSEAGVENGSENGADSGDEPEE